MHTVLYGDCTFSVLEPILYSRLQITFISSEIAVLLVLSLIVQSSDNATYKPVNI